MIVSNKTQLIFRAPGFNRQPSNSPKRIVLQKPMLCITARFRLLRSDIFVTKEHFMSPSGHMALGVPCPRSLFGNWLLAHITGFLEARMCVHTCVVPGARGFWEEATQPSGFLREGAPLWRSAQPGSAPGSSSTAGKAFLLSRPVSLRETKPTPQVSSVATLRRLTWQSVGTFTAFWKCSKQNYMHSKFISVLKVKRRNFYLCIHTNFYVSASQWGACLNGYTVCG